MATLGNTPRPAYVYDTETDTWVPIGVGAHTHDYIPNTLVDAKGDILTATADNTPAKLSIGADGTVLVSDSSTATGLRWQASQAAGKNIIINGGMDIWQRGTSFSVGAAWTYTADRWAGYCDSGTATYAQESTVVPSNSRYSLKVTAGGTQNLYVQQIVETANTLQLAGKTITVSAKVASSASMTLEMYVQYSTSVDSWASITNITATSGGSATPTSSTFVNLTGVYAIPSTAKTLRIYITKSSAFTSGQIMYLGEVQIELGSVPTTFTRAGGTIQGENSLCQRYYYQSWGNGSSSVTGGNCFGVSTSTTEIYTGTTFPVSMRSAPTITIYDDTNTSGTITQPGVGNAISATAADIGTNGFRRITGSGYTAQRAAIGRFIASSEL